jgi:hypothetical protein
VVVEKGVVGTRMNGEDIIGLFLFFIPPESSNITNNLT